LILRKHIIFVIVTLLSILITSSGGAQQEIRNFIFGHSLIHHEFQVNPTPSQETSVPHWMHFLAQAADNEYSVSGQYGFLPQHDNLPPIAQWGFDVVPSAWESDYESFGDAGFNTIMITPGNFIQWQGPEELYYNDDVSPVSATQTIFNWCNEQEEDLRFYIYENWPDMAGYLGGGFPPTEQEWNLYNEYLNGDFHDWFLLYNHLLRESIPSSCIRMIPTGPIISKLLFTAPYDQIPIDQLYEDDAPHGRASIYFLASLVTYMSMYEKEAPENFVVDDIIHPIIRDNYEDVVSFIWEELNSFNDADGNSLVFCSLVSSNDKVVSSEQSFYLRPNPASHKLTISGDITYKGISIYDGLGNLCYAYSNVSGSEISIDISNYTSGLYIVQLIDGKQNSISHKRLLITDHK